MTSIWGFLLQTSEISLIALILIILKKIFQDKLSPKWQYGIWLILLIGLLIPTGIHGRYLFPPIAYLIEMCKTIIERNLASNYQPFYTAIQNTSIFPYITKRPISITDMLMIIYLLGIMISFITYIKQYLDLKRIIDRGYENSKTSQRVIDISNKYGLKPCKTVIIQEIPTALVFGSFHPVLVLPHEDVDEKIILHELLHVKYKDGTQSMIWSILGCFHWCNPWIRHVIKVIKNDIEVLCDQRVLEKLDGEERRDYGKILLEMCSDSYADAFLTTSISNGTKQIKKRIESIVRFKKYPQGLSIVSICILICLTPIAFRSDIYADFIDESNTHYDSWLKKEYQQANAQMVQCQSVAGAIDTFVKGIAQHNDNYLLAVTPNHIRENFDEYIEKLSFEFEDIQYYVINLQEINPNIFKCVLILEEYKGYDEHAVEIKKYEYIPLEITYEKGYKIEYLNITAFDYQMINTFISSNTERKDIVISEKTTKMETGDLSIRYYNIIYPKQEVVHSNMWFSENGLLVNKPDIQADFNRYMYYADISYHTNLTGYQQIGYKAKFYEEKPYDSVIKISTNETGEISISTSDNEILSYYEVDDKWDGIMRNMIDIMAENVIQGESAVKVQIVADGQMIEEIIVEVGD